MRFVQASFVIQTDEADAADEQDFGAMDSGTAEAWLISFTRQLRAQLPANDYIITHARAYLVVLLCVRH